MDRLRPECRGSCAIARKRSPSEGPTLQARRGHCGPQRCAAQFFFPYKSGSSAFPFLDGTHYLCQNVELCEPSGAAVIQSFFNLLKNALQAGALETRTTLTSSHSCAPS